MVVRKVPDIDRIYRRIKDHELVLTGQAPLADALNNRLDRPRLDKLVYTPRGLVYREETGRDTMDRQELFLEIIDRTDLSWKEALYGLENILDCWQETGRLEAILDHESFDNERIRAIVDVLRETESVFKLIEEYQWDSPPETAVLGSYQFKQLDRRVIPDGADDINLLTEDQSADLDPFMIYPSANCLVRSMVDQLDSLSPSDVAIVMEPSSPYQSLVASALKAREIPFMTGRTLTDDLHFRTLFKLMRSGLSHRRLTVRDVRPVLTVAEEDISVRDGEKFVEELAEEQLEDFRSLVANLTSMTFSDVIERYREMVGEPEQPEDALSVLTNVLRKLKLLHDSINQRTLNQLEFYLNSFDIQLDKTRHGVLLASPKSESFVDRSVVFFVGMGADWTRHVPDKPWVDRREHRQRNVKDFQVLLQNGQSRYYLVQEQRLNEPVTPCFYFNVLFDTDFESFSDRPHRRMSGGDRDHFEAGSTFEREEDTPPTETDLEETMSQSTLNTFTRCPREYQMSKLVDEPETIYMKKGILFHDFAEFYVNHPDTIREADESDVVDLMMEQIRPFLDDLREDETRTEFKVGLDNIRQFMDNRPVGESDCSDYRFGSRDNLFAAQFDRPIESSLTEAWFENPDLGARGKIDLIHSSDELVDYKSGSSGSARGIVRRSNLELLEDEDDPDFQALMYLSQHRRIQPNRTLKFTFFHFLDNLSDRVQGRGTIDDTLVTVTYFPRPFSEQVPRESTVEFLRSSKRRRKLIDKLGEDNLIAFFRDHPVENALDKSTIVESELAKEFIRYSRGIVGDYKYVTKGCKGILKQLVKLRTENYFAEDLDRFEEFLTDQLDSLNQYLQTQFPVEGYQGDIDLDRVRHRDLILDDSK